MWKKIGKINHLVSIIIFTQINLSITRNFVLEMFSDSNFSINFVATKLQIITHVKQKYLSSV